MIMPPNAQLSSLLPLIWWRIKFQDSIHTANISISTLFHVFFLFLIIVILCIIITVMLLKKYRIYYCQACISYYFVPVTKIWLLTDIPLKPKVALGKLPTNDQLDAVADMTSVEIMVPLLKPPVTRYILKLKNP